MNVPGDISIKEYTPQVPVGAIGPIRVYITEGNPTGESYRVVGSKEKLPVKHD